MRVGQLWVQQVAEDEVLAYRKICGKSNPADVCTKNVNQTILDAAMTKTSLELREGRAQESLVVSQLGLHGGGACCGHTGEDHSGEVELRYLNRVTSDRH